jgi:TPR repeat protein
MYCDGRGVQRSFAQAVIWFRKSAEQGSTLLAKSALAKWIATIKALSRTIFSPQVRQARQAR